MPKPTLEQLTGIRRKPSMEEITGFSEPNLFAPTIPDPQGLPSEGLAATKAPLFEPTGPARPYSEEFIDATTRGLFRLGSAGSQAIKSFWEYKPKHPAWPYVPETRAMKETYTKEAQKWGQRAKSMWELSRHPEIQARNQDKISWVLNRIGETGPYIAATTGAYSLAGPAGGFAVGSLVEGNSAYRTALDNGVPEDKAKIIGTGVGLISGAIESFGGAGAENLLSRAIERLNSKVLQKGAAFGIGTVIEALEEGSQEIAQMTGESTYRDINWGEFVQRELDSMAGGAMLGGMFNVGRASARGLFVKSEGLISPAEQAVMDKYNQRVKERIERGGPTTKQDVEAIVAQGREELKQTQQQAREPVAPESMQKEPTVWIPLFESEKNITKAEEERAIMLGEGHRKIEQYKATGDKADRDLPKTKGGPGMVQEEPPAQPAEKAETKVLRPEETSAGTRAANKFTKILNYLAEDVKPKQMEAIQKERKQRWIASVEGKESARGREAFIKSMEPLKGEMADKFFVLPEGMENLGAPDIDAMFEQMRLKNDHDMWIRKGKALTKVLRGEIPQPKELELLGQEFGQEFARAAGRKRKGKFREHLLSGIGVPKAFVASFDLSAPLRQGVMLLPGHPVQWGKSFGTMLKTAVPFKGEQWAKDIEQMQKTGRFAELREDAGLYLAPLFEKGALAEREEAFMTRIAQKIPGMKWSERTYVTFLNQLRMNVFDTIARQWEGTGKTQRDYEVLASFINHATGRGDLGRLQAIAPELNAVFFSPRFITSRAQVWLDPMRSNISPAVRKQIAGDLLAFVGTGMTILSLAALGGAEVEKDPRSASFGKIRIGNTRYDIWAGNQQLARLVAQMMTGKKKSSVTGEVQDYPRTTTLARYLQFKLSPGAGFVFDWWRGETVFGEEINLNVQTAKTQAYNRLVPMFIQDVYDGIKIQGLDATTPVTIPYSFLGGGVWIYETSDDPRAEYERWRRRRTSGLRKEFDEWKKATRNED